MRASSCDRAASGEDIAELADVAAVLLDRALAWVAASEAVAASVPAAGCCTPCPPW